MNTWHLVKARNLYWAQKARQKLVEKGIRTVISRDDDTLALISDNHGDWKRIFEREYGGLTLIPLQSVDEEAMVRSRCGKECTDAEVKKFHERGCKSCIRIAQFIKTPAGGN